MSYLELLLLYKCGCLTFNIHTKLLLLTMYQSTFWPTPLPVWMDIGHQGSQEYLRLCPSSSKNHKQSTLSGRHRGTTCPLLPTSILRGLPHAKQSPDSSWKPSPNWAPSLLKVAFTEHGGNGTSSLPDGNHLLWVSLWSQKSNQGMEFLFYLTDGDVLVPRCPVPVKAWEVRT
jgi:hypothetical protein